MKTHIVWVFFPLLQEIYRSQFSEANSVILNLFSFGLEQTKRLCSKSDILNSGDTVLNLLAPELFFLILAQPVYKM